jgi:hypothetical protein
MITLTITNGPSFQVTWKKGMNAQKVMEAAFNNQGTPRTFTYMLQYYGTALGYLVDMIDGTFETTAAPYFYWDFKVDGKDAKKGIDHTRIRDGQTVTFTYQQFDAVQHAGTVIGKKHAIKTAK